MPKLAVWSLWARTRVNRLLGQYLLLELAAIEGQAVSPTVFRERGLRFYFFSREKSRRHVHISCADGEAKYWLEPKIVRVTN